MGTTATNTISSTTADEELLEQAHGGDHAALLTLLERHLHPAWRIALVAAPDTGAAETATIEGFCDGLQAAHRNPDPTQPLRVRIVAATRRAAALAAPTGALTVGDQADAVLHAFLTLPEKSRTAVWLTEVEGGRPEQVGPVLGLDRTATANLAGRAGAALRERLAADVASRAESEDCRRALSKLPAHAAGKLTAAEKRAVGAHVASCGRCALWLASLVSPRPALRRLVLPAPTNLGAAIATRWTELLERERRGWLAPFTERAIGAAAAAILAIGLGGVALLGRDRGRTADLAAPAAADAAAGAATGESAIGPMEADALTASTSAINVPARSSSTTTTTQPKPTTSAPVTTTAPAPTSGSGPTGTDTPRSDGPTDPEAPPPPPESTDVVVDLLDGAVTLGVGDCTGATVLDQRLGCTPEPAPAEEAPAVVGITIPGLPPIGI